MITYNNNGDGTGTVTISFTKDNAILQTVLNRVGQALYEPTFVEDEDHIFHPVTWDDLSNQERLDVVGDGVKAYLRHKASENLKNELVLVAVAEAESDPSIDL